METERRRLLVVGGGWSGIAAAVQAVQKGWAVTLVEERPYLGGRARSFIDRTTGEEIDNGQHLFMGAYHAALKVVRTLGTERSLRIQPSLRVCFVDTHQRLDVLHADRFSGAIGVADAIMRLSHLPLFSRIAIIRLAVRIRLGMISGTGLTCRNLLNREKQPTDAIERFWEPIILATLNAPSDKADARLLVAVMKLAFLGDKDDSKLIIPTRGLSHVIGSFPSWLETHQGECLLSTSCDQIHIIDGRVTSVELSDGRSLPVDAVVTAIPERALNRLLNGEQSFAAGDYSPIVSVYLWYDQMWMEEEFVATLGTTIQWVFNKRRMNTDGEPSTRAHFPGHVSLTISAGSALAERSTDDIIHACDGELRMLFPELVSVNLLHGVVIKEKTATPLITPDTIRPKVNSFINVASNLAIAGDWTDTGLPATIEGAARSGVTAVEWLSSSTTVAPVS